MTKVFKRRVTVALAGGAIVAAVFATGAAAQYGSASNAQGDTTTDASGNPDDTFSPNEIIGIICTAPTGVRCADPGAAVTFDFAQSPGVTLGRTVADANGRYDSRSLGTRIPAGARNGNATISVFTTVNGAATTYTHAITITGAAAAAAGLPVTGKDIMLFVLWGLVLVGFGSFLISATWRRWRQARAEVGVQPASATTAVASRDEDFFANLRPAPTRTMPAATKSAVATLDRAEAAPVRYVEAEVVEPEMPELVSVQAGPVVLRDEKLQERVRDATTQTSTVVSKLQDEIRAWGRDS